jgi:polyhydroxyalkanoate synthase subunit PhaC
MSGEAAAGALAEALAFSQRLASGVQALSQLGEVSFGCSEKDAVYAEDKLTLYRYRPRAAAAGLPPVLVCYALVNRPYMVDLQEDRSLVRGLLERGLDVFLIDWGYPDGADRFLELDDYVNGYLDRCVDQVRAASGAAAINLLGVCQGGTFALCYAALHPEKVANLIAMVTPVDFQTPENLLSRWARALDVDRMVDTLGNIPGELLNATFLALMPFRLTSQKYVALADIVHDPKQLENFVRMEKWIFDSPDQAGEAFRQFVKWLFQENRLLQGRLALGGRRVDLADIHCPVLNVYATQDHLVPPSASLPLGQLVGSKDYSTFAFAGGHIGIYVSGRARQVPQAIADWLASRAGAAATS